MTVHSADGEKLGKVLTCDELSFIVEKGFFFPKDYVARYEDVAEVSGDTIRLRTGQEALRSFDQGEGAPAEPGIAAGAAGIGAEPGIGTSAAGPAYGARGQAKDEVRVPVAEEQLEAVKRERDAGEVRLRKEVVTEQRRIEVPVTREEVRVERVAASPERPATPADRPFEEETVSMPLREEEVELRKRPVVKEEVRVRKDRVVEQRAADAEVRKERVDVEGEEASRIGRGDPKK